jgi:hypothetical protein
VRFSVLNSHHAARSIRRKVKGMMSNVKINLHRRRFLGTAAMALAAFGLATQLALFLLFFG